MFRKTLSQEENTTNDNIFCPFCFEIHPRTKRKCPNTEKIIPDSYIQCIDRNVKNIINVNVGYTAHGKTCFLGSLYCSIAAGEIAKRWENFSFEILSEKTQNEFYNEYIKPLFKEKRVFESTKPLTPENPPNPMFFHFFGVPFKDGRIITTKEYLITFYDVSGETFEHTKDIKQLKMLQEASTITVFIDLPAMLEKSEKEWSPIIFLLHQLFQNMILAIDEFKYGSLKEKALIICFTKTDLMWEKDYYYGPLAKRPDIDLPSDEKFIIDDLEKLLAMSREIEEFFWEKFPGVYNLLKNKFHSIVFTSFSALGDNPIDGKVHIFRPVNIFHPIMWILFFEGCFGNFSVK